MADRVAKSLAALPGPIDEVSGDPAGLVGPSLALLYERTGKLLGLLRGQRFASGLDIPADGVEHWPPFLGSAAPRIAIGILTLPSQSLPSEQRCLLASKEEVEERLNELIDRLGQSDEAAHEIGRSLPDPRTLALHITDLDVWFWTELVEGRLSPPREGQPEEAHIRIRATSDDLIGLIEGGGNLLSAVTSGRVRIKASFSDLLALRKLG
ncbi:MAG: hypothetical protein ACRDHM_08740 [Actinomycetota bacterium]